MLLLSKAEHKPPLHPWVSWTDLFKTNICYSRWVQTASECNIQMQPWRLWAETTWGKGAGEWIISTKSPEKCLCINNDGLSAEKQLFFTQQIRLFLPPVYINQASICCSVWCKHCMSRHGLPRMHSGINCSERCFEMQSAGLLLFVPERMRFNVSLVTVSSIILTNVLQKTREERERESVSLKTGPADIWLLWRVGGGGVSAITPAEETLSLRLLLVAKLWAGMASAEFPAGCRGDEI